MTRIIIAIALALGLLFLRPPQDDPPPETPPPTLPILQTPIPGTPLPDQGDPPINYRLPWRYLPVIRFP